MPDIYRTISGALFRAPNLEHNNRDHIPWNAVQERADRNKDGEKHHMPVMKERDAVRM